VTPLAGIHVQEVVRTDPGWMIASTEPGVGTCPSCGIAANVRHGSYRRSLRDLPVQGPSVTIELTVTRLKCLNQQCPRRTFADAIPNVIGPRARRTSRVSEIVRLLGHSTGGRPSERLLACFGMAVSGDAVLPPLRAEQHPDHVQSRRRRLGHGAGRSGRGNSRPGSPAAPQPRADHSRRPLPAAHEAPLGGAQGSTRTGIGRGFTVAKVAGCCATIKVGDVLLHPAMLPSVKLVASFKCSPGLRTRSAIYQPEVARVAGCIA